MNKKTMFIILLAISAGLFCLVGNIHSQTYYERFTCYGLDGTYYQSNAPCPNNYDYDRGPSSELFDLGSRYRDIDQDRDIDQHRGFEHCGSGHECEHEGKELTGPS
jgi:hypothetical protein